MKSAVLFTLFVNSAVLSAQTIDGRDIVRAEILTDGVNFAKPFTVGIRFLLEPDWYLYWKNPGDSGLPIEVTWMLPEGWTASELRYPVPAKFVHDDMVSYGYKREVILLATITPGNKTADVLSAGLDWLVCKESCLRGKAKIQVPLRTMTASGKVRNSLEAARGKMPKDFTKTSLSLNEGRLTETENSWIAEFRLSGTDAPTITDFYPNPSEAILVDFKSIEVKDGVLRFRFERQNSTGDVVIISGLFIAGSRAYEGTIPLHFTSM